MNIGIASVIFEICIVLSRRLFLARDYCWPVTPAPTRFLWEAFSHAAITREDYCVFTHIFTAVYSQVLVYTAELTDASWRERKCTHIETVAKGGFEPVLSRLRIRHSFTELHGVGAWRWCACDCVYSVRVRVRVRAFVRACVCAGMRVCVRACVRACVLCCRYIARTNNSDNNVSVIP